MDETFRRCRFYIAFIFCFGHNFYNSYNESYIQVKRKEHKMATNGKGGTRDYDVYMYTDKLGKPLWLSDSNNFREAYRHCELYFKKQPKAAILMHDNVMDDWWIYQPDKFTLAVDKNFGA